MEPSRGELWLVNLDPTIGDEMRKLRPAVVVSRDALGVLALRVVVPITAWQDRFAGCGWLVRLDPNVPNGLDKRRPQTRSKFAPSPPAGSCARSVGSMTQT